MLPVDDDFIRCFQDPDSLRLHYQPIVKMEPQEQVYEARARLVADGDLPAPAHFMPELATRGLQHEFNKKIILAAVGDLEKHGTDSRIEVILKARAQRGDG